MRATFHGELTELITDLARMTRLAGQILTNAAIALHQMIWDLLTSSSRTVIS